MAVQTLDPVQIRKIGFKALGETLGHVDMVRFLHFFETGIGDYTKERKKWLGDPSVQEIMRKSRKSGMGSHSPS
ncbi:hypothetical protein KKE26_12540 [bacterium]|nr:hypothetical protein [bacterium]MBU1752470.1 hypothetical protein [bacterium]